jgi:hypothetical protein
MTWRGSAGSGPARRSAPAKAWTVPVAVTSHPALGLSSLLFTGRVTRRQAVELPLRIDPDSATAGSRWINVFDEDADLSELDPDALIEVMSRMRHVVAALSAKGELKVVIVSNSRFNDILADCWVALVKTDESYQSNPVKVSTLGEAFALHGFTPEETVVGAAWLEAELAAARSASASA